MKLATLKDGTRDGTLLVVSRDLKHAAKADHLAPTLQSALGVAHPRIEQKSQGSTGGSFNTREFFHGRTRFFLRSIKWLFVLGVFVAPILLLTAAMSGVSMTVSLLAFVIQYLGLIAERWFFFAEANHPQNLYYQAIA